MYQFRKLLLAAAIVTTVSLAGSFPAHASVDFQPGNNPQPDEENILLNDGTTGAVVFGTTNQSHLVVAFSSTTDTLMEPANGQARVEASDGTVNNITVSVPNGYYGDLIINPFLRHLADSSAAVNVVTDGGTFTYDYNLGNGNNFLTIIATGNKILSTSIDSPSGFDNLDIGNGFNDLQQPRISGAALFDAPHTPVVPEPCSMALLATGALPLLGRLRRRRQQDA